MKQLQTPLRETDIEQLNTGDKATITGIIYTARDKAHQRMIQLLKEGKKLPFDLKGQIIYYAGPAPAKPGKVIGSVGPTTSRRMDIYTPQLLEQGLKGMIGKGNRSEQTRKAIKDNKAVYLATTGGAAALLSQHVTQARVLAFEDLGPEAIYELWVENFPVIVAIDSSGKNLFQEAHLKYKVDSSK